MATGDLEWLAEQIEIKLERMRAKTEREQKMIQRSAELIARAKELLSKPAPKVWPSKRHSLSSAKRRPKPVEGAPGSGLAGGPPIEPP
ncbi:hypothetical protein ACRQ5Q_29070 [Bradyrhizobium sp. PMVTL-01]|uniref:hypothetical protein n=1 Tax=Bradyrhizobium sp. PMVTL-01 TaxID=3434999 RepID=UPI003F6E6C29